MSAGFVDPPLGRSVTSAEMAEKVRAIDNPNNQRLDNPINLSAWFPQRPYWSGADDNGTMDHGSPVLRQWEEYYRKRSAAQDEADRFDAIVLVGGSGPMIDMVNNYRVHDLILGFLDRGKPIARRVLRGRLPRPGARLQHPQEHHLGQARHRACDRIRLSQQHRRA